MSFLIRLAALIAAASALSCCTFHVRESNLIFPRALPAPTLATLHERFPGYRAAPTRIETPDGASLYVLRLMRPDAVATVLYFGGNGYQVAKLAPVTVRSYADAPVNIVLVDHRGYGASRGDATLDALLADAVRVFDHVRDDPQLAGVPVIVHGHSLGSFMAGRVADQRRVAGLILEASVPSTEAWTASLRDKQKPWIRLLVRSIVPSGSLAGKGNGDVVKRLDEPVLFVVGAEDDVAPARFSLALFDATPLADTRKRLLIVPGKSHLDAADSPQFRTALLSFVGEVIGE